MNVAAFLPILLILVIIFCNDNQKKKAVIKKIIIKNNKEMKAQMIELAKKFIGKECLIYTFNSTEIGVIKEVSDGAILIEKDSVPEAINFDFVVRIQEYPKKKNGKKKMIVG